MAETRTFIQAKAKTLPNASTLMSSINAFLYQDLTASELFITMFYLKYQVSTRQIVYASAGHNPPLIWRGDSLVCEHLDAEGLILGIKPEVTFEEKQTRLHPVV